MRKKSINSFIIPFNKPTFAGRELKYIYQAVHEQNKISGDGIFAKRCHQLLENKFKKPKALLTTSCTDAMELAALLLDLKPGDEVIAPSYTFTSTVNAFMLRGAKPVFVDIRRDTLNIDESLIESKISKRTKAIFVVHYAGVACEMDSIMAIAKRHCLPVVEDAAQAVNAKYKNRYLGTIGDFGCFSFHETKNVIAGEGGALLINNIKYIERAEILREKGTNRAQFFRGEVDKYTWVDVGSSFLPSEIIAAFLLSQLEVMDKINRMRARCYARYFSAFKEYPDKWQVVLPTIPKHCSSNHHLFFLLLRDEEERDELSAFLKRKGILSIFHYVPLHSSPMGKKLGYREGDLPVSEDISRRLLRLPFYNGLTVKDQNLVIAAVHSFFKLRTGYAI